MTDATATSCPPDEAFLDGNEYGSGPEDFITDTSERAAVTQHDLGRNDNERQIPYTATVGHLVTRDPYSARPAAKIFYVAFTVRPAKASRPITFFYNGGPGSSSVFLLLGSFGPRRIQSSFPYFTPPAPYRLDDNPDTLLDTSDLVFINPVGTGYSAAIAPNKNRDFWGVDADARCIRQFIKRYLTAFNRWNSPKFLFGESYGTPRTCVLTWLLHEDGVDLNGVILQSSVLDYAQSGNPIGLLPTFAADAWAHDKVAARPRWPDLPRFMDYVVDFARKKYAPAKALLPAIDQQVLVTLSGILGVRPELLRQWKLDPSASFLTSLLDDQGVAVGAYDGRVAAESTGIARSLDPNSGGNDPTMTAIGGVYTAMWNVYLNSELQFASASPFMDMNDQAFVNWDFAHTDPTGAEKGGKASLYTAGDLAAAMALNPYLKTFSANGYYDAVTPFLQTELDFENMPFSEHTRRNLTIQKYESGHMIYLDDRSRAKMKEHLAVFYREVLSSRAKKIAARTATTLAVSGKAEGEIAAISILPFRRRFGRTPY